MVKDEGIVRIIKYGLINNINNELMLCVLKEIVEEVVIVYDLKLKFVLFIIMLMFRFKEDCFIFL